MPPCLSSRSSPPRWRGPNGRMEKIYLPVIIPGRISILDCLIQSAFYLFLQRMSLDITLPQSTIG